MPKVIVGPEGLTIAGEPALIQAGLLHYLRLPHPDLWGPMLDRMRMGGLNAVIVPFPWAYHAPAPGFHDFTGSRAITRLLDKVVHAGLWLIPHVGPWLGSDLDAGGLPAWLLQSDALRPAGNDTTASNADLFLRHVERWWARLLPYIRDHANLLFVMLDAGRHGPVGGADNASLSLDRKLLQLIRRLGLRAPCALPASAWDGLSATREGAEALVDPATPFGDPPTLGLPAHTRFLILAEGAVGDERLGPSETADLLLVDLSGPVTWLGSRPAPAAQALGAEHPRRRIGRSVVDGAGAIGLSPYHMGANWGWWATPEAGTLYGYGAPVAEGGGLPDAYYDGRRMALTLETVGEVLRRPDMLSMVEAEPPAYLAGSQAGRFGTVVVLESQEQTEGYANVTLERGARRVTVEDILVPAKATRVVPIDWRIGGRRLVGSTMEPVLRTQVAGRELLILYNEAGGEVLLPGEFRPRHHRGPVFIERAPYEGAESGLMAHFDPARLGSLVLDGPEGVLQILALAPSLAGRVWPLDDLWRTSPSPAPAWRPSMAAPAAGVVIGPDLVVPEKDGGFRFLVSEKGFGYRWGPWRGSDPHTWLAPLLWRAPPPLSLPPLAWISRPGAPEALPDYDDRSWRRIAPEGPFSMEAQDVYYGFIWYRVHFTGDARSVTLKCRHACDLYLNGEHIATLNPPPDLGSVAPKTLPLSSRHLREQNVLALLVENMGRHAAWDRAAEPHGLISCTIAGAEDVDWRTRGGLTGEVRVQGFPGYADWGLVPPGELASHDGAEHVSWHRAQFEVDLPDDVAAPLFLELDRTPTKAYIYLNQRMIGRMWYPQGAQRRFWLPDGVLKKHGPNELLVAQWARGADPGIGMARLTHGVVGAWHREAVAQG